MRQPTDTWEWVGSMITVSGREVNVMQLTPDQVDLGDVACSLARICRYNGHVPTHYSVAEHSIRVAQWLARAGHGPGVQLTGLLHDASEAYVGDMIRPLKKHPDFGRVHQQLEHEVSIAVHAALGGMYPHPQVVHDADKAVYEWEVENIRAGGLPGWPAFFAESAFHEWYAELRGAVNE